MPSSPLSLRRRTRAAVAALTGAAVALGGLVAAADVASAVPPAGAATTSVTVGGNSADHAAVDDTLDVVTDSPVTAVGTVTHTITRTWPTSGAHLSGSVRAPEGWTVDYRTAEGWSSTLPSDPATVDGVRAYASLASGGVSAGHQISTTDAGGTLKVGSRSFSGSGGGDGWNVFFAGSKVLNVFHHNNAAYSLDCHKRSDGSACSASGVYSKPGYVTSGASSGSAVGAKVYSIVGSEASGAGVLCTDTSTTPFTDCGYTRLITGGYSSYDQIGSQAIADGKVYAAVSSGALLCYDTGAQAPCTGQPYTLAGFTPTSTVPAYTVAIGTRVYVASHDVRCYDSATDAECPGTWPTQDDLGWSSASVIPRRAGDGTLNGVCTVRPAGYCYDLTGAPVSVPNGLTSLLDSRPASSMGDWSDFVAATATKQYWISGTSVTCYDWTTDAACAGFTGADVGWDRYAVVVDPTDDRCLWTNGDSGVIRPVNGLTGALGCPAPPDPVIVLPYTAVVPRMSCADTTRVLAWNSMRIDPPAAIDRASMRVTIDDADGNPVPGYTDISVPGDGVLDLSALDVAATGQKPSMELRAIGASDADATDVHAVITYTSPAPQLCVPLAIQRDCPTLTAGRQAADTVPVADLTIAGTAVTTVNDTDTSQTLDTAVSRADQSGCVGTASGTVNVQPAAGPVPVSGTTVTVSTGSGDSAVVHASTTTDDQGSWNVTRLAPGTYTVTALGRTASVTVAAADTAEADITMPVDDPRANDVTIFALLGAAGTGAVTADVDASTSLDTTSVQILDPDTETWGTALTVDGEGTWTVVAGGSLRFTPVDDTFRGMSTEITYRVRDGYGTAASAHALAVVDDTPPTAANTSASGVQGQTLGLAPQGITAVVPLLPGSLRLIDPQTAQPATQVVLDGVGTFRVDTDEAMVWFVPEGSFVGTHSLVFQIRDRIGRAVTANVVVTETALRPRAVAVTVRAGQTATSRLTGVPDGATVTVPAGVTGSGHLSATTRAVSVPTPVTTSGLLRIPVTVDHGTATVATTAVVTVLPQAALSGAYRLTAKGAQFSWKRSPTTSVVGYRVLVNGRLVCTSKALTCGADVLAGPRSQVTVVAVGRDATLSAPTRLTYLKGQAVYLVDVFFASGSATLDAKSRTTLDRAAARIKAEGFTGATMIGYTDSNAGPAYNLKLSRNRVANTGGYLRARVKGLTIATGALGENDPRADNSTAAGRALNRRVEIRVS